MTHDEINNKRLSGMSAISAAIDKLRACTQLDIRATWHWSQADLTLDQVLAAGAIWPIAPLDDRHYILWPAGKQVLWLYQQFTIPEALTGYPLEGLTLRLALRWWADQAEIFVNGRLVQVGDLFDCFTRIELTPAAVVGETITVAIRCWSPGHDEGALVESRLVYEVPEAPSSVGARGLSPLPIPEPGFVADELEVVRDYVAQFVPEDMGIVAGAIAHLDWSTLSQREIFNQSLAQLRQTLQPIGEQLKCRQIHFLGHAHLDMAWLWPVAETWDMAERTFASALNLQEGFPDLVFGHSTPALYDWLEQNRPDQFTQIQTQVAAGQWEIIAGLWVEPEFNTVNGESIIRQVIYGQRYVQEKFGQLSTVAWLPDSFGFCWQLPQILKQGGIDCFATQKLRWNDSTTFPHELFQWEAPDGTQVLGWTLPPIGEDIQPVKMATYANEWAQKTQSPAAFWLPGIGDHGGGPTRDMLMKATRWGRSPLFPTLKSTSAQAYLAELDVQGATAQLPVWQDELYLEFHRGCYTTHADQKLRNRRCEDLLYQAELWASLAQCMADAPYPKAELETAWKTMLFQQFHDILPGSAIPQVFIDANRDWDTVETAGQTALQAALTALAERLPRPSAPLPDAVPIIVFNSLNWQREALVTVPLRDMQFNHSPPPRTSTAGAQGLAPLPNPAPPPGSPGDLGGGSQPLQRSPLDNPWQIVNETGQILPTQPIHTDAGPALLVELGTLPSVGYRWIWLTQQSETSLPVIQSAQERRNDHLPPLQSPKGGEHQIWTLENQILKVSVNPDTGDLDQVFDKVHQRNVLRGPGNQLQSFQDQGQYWDAWNIDPDYEHHRLPPTQLQSIQWIEQGPLRWRLRVVRLLGQSIFQQDYVLEGRSPLLTIETKADWRERHVMVKAAFPLTISADFATYEIPCGAIQRPTHPQTPEEKAKWEVPALRWADLSQPDYGVSLLNDCKYGYDAQPDQLRLTLLRSPTWPDPEADQGHHRFTYALYPHTGAWQAARTVHYGYELNLPPLWWMGEDNIRRGDHAPMDKSLVGAWSPRPSQDSQNANPATASLLDLGTDQFILSALKPAETAPSCFILRGYECHGQTTQISLQGVLRLGEPVDLLEMPDADWIASENSLADIRPWHIQTWLLNHGNA